MLMVIFGAGASYDSAPAYRPVAPSSSSQNFGLPAPPSDNGGPWRPPLAPDLFRDPDNIFCDIVQRYPKLSHILPYLREPGNGRSVEEELEFLQAQAHDYQERLRQFASVQYYLRDLLFEVSDQWRNKTSGITNYAPLIDEILRLDKSGEPICLVTFNYDLLLDRALVSFGFNPQDPEVEYFAHPRIRLFKPHGSVNWARFVDLNPDPRFLPEHLIERADTIRLTDEFVTITGVGPEFPRGRTAFPVIAIPFQNKNQDTFVWPSSHRAHLVELLPRVTKILIIGWQAKEAHFLELLQSSLRGVMHLMAVGSNTSDSDQILQNFGKQIAKALHPKCNWYKGQGGFTQFVVNRQGDEFFKA